MGWSSSGIFARVVLEVGVLDDDDIAGGLAKAAGHGGALALILRLQQHAHAVVPVEVGQDRPRPIPRPVVHDDEFFLDVAEINGEDSSDDLPDRRLLVVAGHHDGQFHGEDLTGLGRFAASGAARGLRPARRKISLLGSIPGWIPIRPSAAKAARPARAKRCAAIPAAPKVRRLRARNARAPKKNWPDAAGTCDAGPPETMCAYIVPNTKGRDSGPRKL